MSERALKALLGSTPDGVAPDLTRPVARRGCPPAGGAPAARPGNSPHSSRGSLRRG